MIIWQTLARRWSQLVFGEHFERITPKIRSLRVLEEAMELAQSEGVTPEELQIIADQVYSKPVNPDPKKELGGVIVTLTNYADTRGYNLEESFYSEYCRILDPTIMARVRNRNLAGDKIGMK